MEKVPDKNRARRILGAGLMAGALAAGSPAHAQNSDMKGQDESSGDYGADYSADYSDYSYKPSQEIIDLFDGLDKEIGDSKTITPDQIAKVHASIDDFLAKHPAYEGKTEFKTDANGDSAGYSEASYSPYIELQEGLWWGPEKNPIIIGLSMAYIKEKAAAEKSAESK